MSREYDVRHKPSFRVQLVYSPGLGFRVYSSILLSYFAYLLWFLPCIMPIPFGNVEVIKVINKMVSLFNHIFLINDWNCYRHCRLYNNTPIHAKMIRKDITTLYVAGTSLDNCIQNRKPSQQ
jgi:hypothetical protein